MRRDLKFVKCLTNSTSQLSSPLWENLQVPIINNLQGIPAMNVEAGEWAVESRRGSSIPIMGEPAGADHLEPAAWPISAPPSDGVPVIKINVIILWLYFLSCHHVHHGGSSITLAPKGGLTLQSLSQANCDNLLSTT